MAYTRDVAGRLIVCCLAVLIVVGNGVIASSASSRTLKASPASRTWSIVTLGDSVPRGTNCHCAPYPQIIAERLAAAGGQSVTSTNDSVAGFTTVNVLRQLSSDRDVIANVRGADAVGIEVGANDVAYSRTCGTRVSCYAGRVPAMGRRLAAIVSRIHALTPGRRVGVVLLDYWSIWLGGRYAAAKGHAYVAAAREMTDRVNAVIKLIAANSGSAYVDLRAAFKGPSYAYDETRYLSNDGDHPNAAGHKQIAAAAASAIENALHI
jgi:lysophospholipase L1-like esterase